MIATFDQDPRTLRHVRVDTYDDDDETSITVHEENDGDGDDASHHHRYVCADRVYDSARDYDDNGYTFVRWREWWQAQWRTWMVWWQEWCQGDDVPIILPDIELYEFTMCTRDWVDLL